ncbi:MAG: TIGR04282 family arsenosugar biosynthesis glycosyltransferase [Candidatus Eisenbacteria bacterium]|nr:TIGR04282 family arsenosugar biosynthesis glycosyltransferase [Candidatus Eisenbacteria bacterium]
MRRMNRLGVFARHPVAGTVKTRLSPALPAALAARLYEAMLADTRAEAAACDAARTWWWADGGAPLADPAFEERAQEGGSLGERLAHAMTAMRCGDARSRAVIVGSDCPALVAGHLRDAFAALAHTDVVLGPATDGGYWLVGARRECDALFHDVPWSTPDVLRVTRERAAAEGWRVATLGVLPDLDEPDDVVALVAALAAGNERACGPALRAALNEAGLAR